MCGMAFVIRYINYCCVCGMAFVISVGMFTYHVTKCAVVLSDTLLGTSSDSFQTQERRGHNGP